MPSVNEILLGLERIAQNWPMAAIFWHAYFGIAAAALLFGFRPSRRLAGFLLVPPLLSVSVFAWISRNPFNGLFFAVLAVWAIYLASGLPGGEKVRFAPPWFIFPGLALFVFGWAYPHFIEASSPWPYLYRTPTGLIPCPTLSIIIGLMLVLDGLGSRALVALLGLAGLFYGIFGVARLGVTVDWTLLLGAAVLLARGVRHR